MSEITTFPQASSTIKIESRVKAPPQISVSIGNADPFQAELIAQAIFDRLRDKYEGNLTFTEETPTP